uniref:Peroxin-7 n=1 Tax=Meloidogyne javanica TaxID=6303 RepID=A0A915M5V0_MELJA
MLPHEIQQFMGSGAFASSDPLFHSDTIHHVEFDFYGKRVVTVSSDKLKHGGAVWKARFAHPEFGQVLATCSFDNTIQIFDKDAVDVMDARSSMSASDFSNGWVCRTVLRQSTSSITDIQFAPHYLGLQLAACTSSGRLVIYEAEDIMALDNWNGLNDF